MVEYGACKKIFTNAAGVLFFLIALASTAAAFSSYAMLMGEQGREKNGYLLPLILSTIIFVHCLVAFIISMIGLSGRCPVTCGAGLRGPNVWTSYVKASVVVVFLVAFFFGAAVRYGMDCSSADVVGLPDCIAFHRSLAIYGMLTFVIVLWIAIDVISEEVGVVNRVLDRMLGSLVDDGDQEKAKLIGRRSAP